MSFYTILGSQQQELNKLQHAKHTVILSVWYMMCRLDVVDTAPVMFMRPDGEVSFGSKLWEIAYDRR